MGNSYWYPLSQHALNGGELFADAIGHYGHHGRWDISKLPDWERSLDRGGSGLGLSNCKSIVKNHEGTIDIQSEWGRGTFVTIGCLTNFYKKHMVFRYNSTLLCLAEKKDRCYHMLYGTYNIWVVKKSWSDFSCLGGSDSSPDSEDSIFRWRVNRLWARGRTSSTSIFSVTPSLYT